MMDVNLLLYLFLFRIDEPKNLTAEKNRRGGRISRGKHTQHAAVALSPFLLLCKTHKNLVQITRERESCAKNEGKSAAKFNTLQPVTSMHRFLLNIS